MISLPIGIKKDLDDIKAVAEDLKMKVYVVGGFPRDLVAGIGVDDDTDVDVTESNGNAFDLAFFVAAKYNLKEPKIYKSSGTAMVQMPSGRIIEFHNAYFNVPYIIDQLYVLGIEPSPINKDVYARDFTINTLLFDPDDGKIYDLTKKGIHDIRNGLLRTPLKPDKTLGIDPRRILRGIRFKIQFGLEYEKSYGEAVMKHVPNLIKFMQENPDSKMIERTINKCLILDSKKALDEFEKIGIISFLPKSHELDKATKEHIMGVGITPVSLKNAQFSRGGPLIEGPSGSRMIQHLMDSRDRHKSYMRRKKREKQKRDELRSDIFNKLDNGEFESGGVPPVQREKKSPKMQTWDRVIKNVEVL